MLRHINSGMFDIFVDTSTVVRLTLLQSEYSFFIDIIMTQAHVDMANLDTKMRLA